MCAWPLRSLPWLLLLWLCACSTTGGGASGADLAGAGPGDGPAASDGAAGDGAASQKVTARVIASPARFRRGVATTVTLSAGSSEAGGGDALRFRWILGGGVVQAGGLDQASVTVRVDGDSDLSALLRIDNNRGSDSTMTTVRANNAPVAVARAAGLATVGKALRLDASGTSDPEGDPVTFSWRVAQAPSGSQAALGGADTATPTLTPDRVGTYQLELNASDALGFGNPLALTLTALGTSRNPPAVTLTATPPSAAVGAAVALAITAQGDAPITTTRLTVNGAVVAVQGGQASFTPAAIGAYDAVVTVTDQNGNSASARQTFTARAAADNGPPTVSLSAPANEARVSGAVDIMGSVADADLVRYTLEVQGAGSDRALVLASGAQPINGRILTLDPTLFNEGTYVLRLFALDSYGNTASAERNITLTDVTAIGPSRVRFVDLSLAVLGVPLRVERRYDSFDRREADFGHNWSLRLGAGDAARLDVPGAAGEGWTVSGACSFFSTPSPIPLKAHTMTLRLGGRTFNVAFQPKDPSCWFVAIPQAKAHWVLTGTTYNATVEVEGEGATLSYTNGALQVGDPNALQGVYDPASVKITLPNGTSYSFRRPQGLVKVSDASGNTVDLSNGKITLSSGAAVAMDRDARGRVTALGRPDGKRRTYEYNSVGDLVASVDFDGGRTTYVYAPEHLLTAIYGPSGALVQGFEYDGLGRLTAYLDPQGRRTTVQIDPQSGAIAITDPLGAASRYAYDSRGNLTLVTAPSGDTNRFEYDVRGNQTAWVNPLGKRTTWTYDALNNVTQVLHPTGRAETFSYDGQTGALLGHSDGLGHTESQAFDAQGRLVSFTDLSGATSALRYDQKGALSGITLPGGRDLQLKTDAAGNITELRRADGGVESYGYDDEGKMTTHKVMLRGAPALSTLRYDDLGYLVKLENPGGVASSRILDEDGRPTEVRHALGGVTRAAYDEGGRLLTANLPGGGSATHSYDARGRLLTATVTGIGVNRYGYDAAGRLETVSRADGTTERRVYGPAGQVKSITSTSQGGAMRAVQQSYDEYGRLTRVDMPGGAAVSLGYDSAGRLVSRTGPDGVKIDAELDGLGRPTKLQSGAVATTMTYAESGLPATITDALNNKTTLTYDAVGRVISATDAEGASASYTHDEGGLASLTDPAGGKQTYEHDATGALLRHTLAGGAVEQNSVDMAQRVRTHSDFAGHRTTVLFDEAGRPLDLSVDDGTRLGFEYLPLAQGRRALIDGRGRTELVYDGAGRLSAALEPDGRAVRYSYDAQGLLAAVQTPGGTTRYSYDGVGRLTTLTDAAGQSYRYSFDSAGRLASIAFPSGATESYSYNGAGRLAGVEVKQQNQSLLGESYSYDAAGRLVTITAGDGAVTSYRYDRASRLLEERYQPAQGAAVVQSYSYNPAGDLLTQSDGDTTRSFTYDVDHRLLSDGVASYRYDGNGNLLEVSGGPHAARYQWSALGRLLRADTTGAALGVHRIDYGYDADGLLVERTVDGVRRRLLWDRRRRELGQLAQALEESDDGGAVVAAQVVDPLARVLARRDAARVRYLHRDRIGSVRLLTDEAGQRAGQRRFTPYGTLAAGTAVDEAQPYGFAGERLDPASGLYYLRARHYAPQLGRFLSRDGEPPDLRDTQGQNPYSYARGAPTLYRDPSGRTAILEYIGVGETTWAMARHVVGQAGAIALYGLDVVAQAFAGGFRIFDFLGAPDGVVFGNSVQFQANSYFAGLVTGFTGSEAVFSTRGGWGAAFAFAGASANGIIKRTTLSIYGGLCWDLSEAGDYKGWFHSFTAPYLFLVGIIPFFTGGFLAGFQYWSAIYSANASFPPGLSRTVTHFYSPGSGAPGNPDYLFHSRGRYVKKDTIQAHGLATTWSYGYGGDRWQMILGDSNLFTFAISYYLDPVNLW